MANSPTLGLMMMSASQSQKEVVFNEFLIAMDALFRGVALSSTLTAPPASPNEGDTYIVATGATGAWSGQDNNITFYFNGWQFVTAKDQMRLYDQGATEWRVYHASMTSWVAEPASTVSVLTDLTNVTGTPTNGQVLTFESATGKWTPENPVFTAALSSLTDVTVTEGAPINGYGLAWNQTAAKWEPTQFLTATPNILAIPEVTAPTGVANGWIAVYNATGPGLTFVNPTSIALVTSLSNVGDVAYPTGGATAIVTGQVLTWNGAAWAPTTITSGGGGGSSTLGGDTDVDILSPTDGQVLTWHAGSSKWINAAPTGGSGGGTVLLPPSYELGPFAPPLAAWFSTSNSASEPTLVGPTDVTGRGLSFGATGFTAGNQLACLTKSISAWTGAWSLTARLVVGILPGQYPQGGLFLMDTTGKVQEVCVTGVNGICYAGVTNLNNVDNSFNANLIGSTETPVVPEWLRIRTDGAHYIYGWSTDGLNWQEYPVSTSEFLGTLAYAGVMVAGDSNQAINSVNAASVLITYWDDPDHPASGHTQTTQAALEDLTNVAVASPADGQVLSWNGADWVNVTPGKTGLFNQVLSDVPTQASTGLTTWMNQGAATVADTAVGVCITAPSAGGDNHHCLTVAAPSAPYKLTALLTRACDGSAGDDFGIGWTDGTKLQITTLATESQTGNYILVQEWSNTNSYNTNNYVSNSYTNSVPAWLQIEDDGVNVYFRWGVDGVNFMTLYTVAKASGYLSSYDTIVLALSPKSGANLGTLMSWTLTA